MSTPRNEVIYNGHAGRARRRCEGALYAGAIPIQATQQNLQVRYWGLHGPEAHLSGSGLDHLATAYQISDNIVVLYRGSVVEAGDVELVVKQPHHPYTQLLMSAIPLASAERTWTTESGSEILRFQATESAGCKFAERCPRATSSCLQAVPPLFHTDRYRAVSCYLYQSAPALAADEMGQAFAASAKLSHRCDTAPRTPPEVQW